MKLLASWIVSLAFGLLTYWSYLIFVTGLSKVGVIFLSIILVAILFINLRLIKKAMNKAFVIASFLILGIVLPAGLILNKNWKVNETMLQTKGLPIMGKPSFDNGYISFSGVNSDSLELQLIIYGLNNFKLQGVISSNRKFDFQNRPALPFGAGTWVIDNDRLILEFSGFPKPDVKELFKGNLESDVLFINDDMVSLRKNLDTVILNETKCVRNISPKL